mmetsp:Transcript_21101/g.53230  ORF Transcript_21101/g.53230 Transcript_21101/m.53230 type:complete len:213 (+) Transcript_21101:1992-2630(+)
MLNMLFCRFFFFFFCFFTLITFSSTTSSTKSANTSPSSPNIPSFSVLFQRCALIFPSGDRSAGSFSVVSTMDCGSHVRCRFTERASRSLSGFPGGAAGRGSGEYTTKSGLSLIGANIRGGGGSGGRSSGAFFHMPSEAFSSSLCFCLATSSSLTFLIVAAYRGSAKPAAMLSAASTLRTPASRISSARFSSTGSCHGYRKPPGASGYIIGKL